MIGLSFSEFSPRRTQLGSLFLDVLVSEEIDLAAEVTRYPVESGVTISDHVTQGVETVRISGLVSTADVSAFTFGASGMMKMVDAVDMLREMHKARALVTITTGQMQYTEMAFTNLNALRTNDSQGGNWLQVRGELVKVRKVTLKQVDVPAETTAAAPARGRAGATNTPAGRVSPTSTPAGNAGATPPAAPSDTFLRSIIRQVTGK